MADPRDPEAPVQLDHPAEDLARASRTVADLIDEDRLDPETPDHFEVELEPVEEPYEDQGAGGAW